MSEFSFLGTWNDSRAILNSILDGGEFCLIPDLKYDGPTPLYFKDLDDRVETILKDRRHLFIWGHSFSLFPPVLERIEEGPNAGRYSIRLCKGGPGLELTLPACYEDGGTLNLAPGTLSCPTKWLNPKENAWRKSSAEIAAAFKIIVARMKPQVFHHASYPKIWIGQDALHFIETKKARISGFEGRRDSSD